MDCGLDDSVSFARNSLQFLVASIGAWPGGGLQRQSHWTHLQTWLLVWLETGDWRLERQLNEYNPVNYQPAQTVSLSPLSELIVSIIVIIAIAVIACSQYFRDHFKSRLLYYYCLPKSLIREKERERDEPWYPLCVGRWRCWVWGCHSHSHTSSQH